MTLNNEIRNSIDVTSGSSVDWKVEATGYVTQSGTEIVTSDIVKNDIVLSKQRFTFTINPTPSDATVKLNGQTTKSITVDYGTTVNWSVSRTNYITQSGNQVVTSNTTKTITLSQDLVTFTINPKPSNATVTLNGSNRKSITVVRNSTVSWSVSLTDYQTQSGSQKVTGNTTKNVTLTQIAFNFQLTVGHSQSQIRPGSWRHYYGYNPDKHIGAITPSTLLGATIQNFYAGGMGIDPEMTLSKDIGKSIRLTINGITVDPQNHSGNFYRWNLYDGDWDAGLKNYVNQTITVKLQPI